MRSRVRLALCGALLLVASGAACRTAFGGAGAGPRLAPCAGPLPSTRALTGSFVWRERVRVRGSGVDQILQLVVQKRGDELVVVALDPLGVRHFSLRQVGTEVVLDAPLGGREPVPPANLLRDLHELRLADPAARSAEPVRVERPECGYSATWLALDVSP